MRELILPKNSRNTLWRLSAFCLTIAIQFALLFTVKNVKAESLNSASNHPNVHPDYLSDGCRKGRIELIDISDWLLTDTPPSAHFTSTPTDVYETDFGEADFSDKGTIGTLNEEVAALDMDEGQMIQVGYTTVFPGVSTGPSRRAEQVTIPIEGVIQSVSIYHNGGSGGLLLAVYSDNAGTPGTRLGVTPTATVNSTEGWQELALIYPVSVIEGQKVWLAWLTETAVGLRYGYDSPGRIDSGSPWSGGMPMVFGSGTSTGAVYSLYATVIEEAVQSTPNLVAHWELDNSPADASRNNIHGTINGSPQFVNSAIVGSHAIEFNGVDQYIDFGNPTQLPSGRSPRTMSAWLKTNDVSYDYRFAVAYGKAAVSSAMFIGQRGAVLCAGGYGNDLTVSNFWEADTWHHIVLTYGDSIARLYADGEKVASSYKDWSLVLDRVYLGRQINYIEYWNGAVDDVRIYDKALSDAEVLDLYNQHASNYIAAPTNLVISQTASQKVELTWQDNSENEEGFILERSVNGGVFSHLDSLGVNTSSYQDSTVAIGSYYQYRLFAFNASLNSDSVVIDSLYIKLYQPNLVAHWELDNSPNDASGNNIHGIINGNPQFVQSAIVGSHAIEFNGVDQYIDFGNPTQLPSGRSPRTMSAWLKTNDVSYDYRFAVAYGKAAVSSAMFMGQRGTELCGGGGADGLAVNDFWEIDTWHHVVLTYDGDTARLYGDGVMLASTYKNWSLILDKVYLGRNINNIAHWNGAVDDVRIYDKALSDAEVLDLYNQHASNYIAAPTNLEISQTADQKVEITWQDNSDNEDGFIVERSENGGVFSHLDSLGVDTNSYQDSTVVADNYYQYRLFAFNTSLTSDTLVTDSLHILNQPNLVAHWELDNSPNDASGNNIHGELIGNPQFVQSAIVGSHAIELNGVDQYIDFGNPTQLPSGRSPRTMSAWLKTNDVSYEYRFAVAYGKATVSSAMFMGQRGTELCGGGGADGLAVNDFWEIDTWHHVVLTYDGDTARLYADGVQRAKSYKVWSLILDKTYVGRQINNQEYWNGAVDDVRIYEKALSDAEVLDLYNQHAGNYLAAPSNLVLNQTADQKVELTWQDNSEDEEGFIVERSENGGVFSHLDSLGINTSSYQDSTVVAGNYYQYRLFAFNTSLTSDTLVTDSLHILNQPNLVAHWELDNSPNDASGNNIHGTINGSPQFVSSAKVGSHAIEFNGADQYIDFGNPTQLPSGRSPRTMSAWVKTNSVSSGNRFAVAYGKEATNSAMVIGQSGTQLIGGGYGDAINVNGFWEIGTWHHIVLTYDGDTAKLYADGIMLSYSYMNWSLSLDKVYIGRQVNDLKYWNGYVDDVRIYDKALSDAEILDLYNQHANNYLAAPTNLVISQTADQKVEITWQDNSDNEDGFIIERKITADNLFTILGSVPADTTNYIDTSVASNTSYDYRIKAHNATDSSAYSNIVSIGNIVDEGNVPDAVELNALRAIYYSLDGDNWVDNSGWLDGVNNLDFGKWKGVTIWNGDVGQLDLYSNNLTGALPPEIGNLSALCNLNLDNNKINSLPDELFLLPNIWSIILNSNELTEIPSAIENFENLHYVQMDISNNLLETLPFEIIYPWDLMIIWAENNYLDFENLCTFYGEPDTNDYNHFFSPQRSKFTETLQVTLQDNTLLDAVRVNAYGSNLYQWQKYDGNAWQNISGQTSQTLNISASNNDYGAYRCEVTNSVITKLTLYSPVYHAVAYVTAVDNGDWNDPSTWSGLPEGTVPNKNHIITISGHTVTVDHDFEIGDITLNNAEANTGLIINGGHLKVYGKVQVQNVNPENSDCKLEVTGTGKISVLNSNE